MLDFILVPLQYPFILRSMLAVFLVGIVCATVGTFVVLRGMAFFGDALAHAVLPGVAAGYLIGGGDRGALMWGALAAALISSLGIGAITKGARLREDTAIGVVFAGMFALGVALISTQEKYAGDLEHYLFGNVLGVSAADLWLIGGLGAVVVLAVILLYKEFVLLSFDPLLAATLRLPSQLLEYTLLVLIALTIVVALQTVGVLLMVAMLITPAAAASMLTKRLPVMIVLAGIIASVSGVVGLYLSYYAQVASGAAIVLTCTAFFGIAWIGRNLWPNRSKRASKQAAGEQAV